MTHQHTPAVDTRANPDAFLRTLGRVAGQRCTCTHDAQHHAVSRDGRITACLHTACACRRFAERPAP